jgi:hypothetical protein
MEKKKILFIGAILEIIAGAVWMMTALTLMTAANLLGQGVFLCIVQLILSVAIIFSGVMFCVGRIFSKKISQELNVLINILAEVICIVIQFIMLCFANLETVTGALAMETGVLPIVLLLVSSFFFYFWFSIDLQTKNVQKQIEYQDDEISNKLEKLKKLYDEGAINEQLYNAAKEKFINKIID